MTMVERLKNLYHTQLSKMRVRKTDRITKRKEKEVAADGHAYDATSVTSYVHGPEMEIFESHDPDDQYQ